MLTTCKRCGKDTTEQNLRLHLCNECKQLLHDNPKEFYDGFKTSPDLAFFMKEKMIRDKIQKLVDQQESEPFYEKKTSCEVCGETEKPLLEHHIKYSPVVKVTLCYSCHGKLHARLRKVKRK